jgi:hypothetical protein
MSASAVSLQAVLVRSSEVSMTVVGELMQAQVILVHVPTHYQGRAVGLEDVSLSVGAAGTYSRIRRCGSRSLFWLRHAANRNKDDHDTKENQGLHLDAT